MQKESDGTKRKGSEIDFQTFRLLSTGMTRQEVLSLAGPPAEQSVCDERGSCSERWIYYYSENWVAEISFSEFGQVANINSYRQP